MLFANIFHALGTPEGQVQFWGAFFAATFSLLTLAIAAALSSIFKRKVKHYDALVVLETRLNQHVARMHDTIFILRGFLKTNEAGKISFNNPSMLIVQPIGNYESLLDVGLINELFSYDHDLDKLNDDLSNMGATYSELRSSVITGQLPPNQLHLALPQLLEELNLLIKMWEKQIDGTITLAAYVRLMLKRDRSLLVRCKLWILRLRMKPITKKEVRNEKKKILTEIKKVEKVSRKAIQEIVSKET